MTVTIQSTPTIYETEEIKIIEIIGGITKEDHRMPFKAKGEYAYHGVIASQLETNEVLTEEEKAEALEKITGWLNRWMLPKDLEEKIEGVLECLIDNTIDPRGKTAMLRHLVLGTSPDQRRALLDEALERARNKDAATVVAYDRALVDTGSLSGRSLFVSTASLPFLVQF